MNPLKPEERRTTIRHPSGGKMLRCNAFDPTLESSVNTYEHSKPQLTYRWPPTGPSCPLVHVIHSVLIFSEMAGKVKEIRNFGRGGSESFLFDCGMANCRILDAYVASGAGDDPLDRRRNETRTRLESIAAPNRFTGDRGDNTVNNWMVLYHRRVIGLYFSLEFLDAEAQSWTKLHYV